MMPPRLSPAKGQAKPTFRALSGHRVAQHEAVLLAAMRTQPQMSEISQKGPHIRECTALKRAHHAMKRMPIGCPMQGASFQHGV